MNSDLLAAFLKDQNGFEGGAFELYTRLKRRPEFLTIPACGEDFLLELRRRGAEMKGRGVDVVCLPDGGVRIKTPLEAREDRMSDNLLRAQYRESPQLRREFSSFESYAAYEKANASGRVHVARVGNKDNQQCSQNADVDARLPLEERCQQRWAIEPATRAEFRDNYGAFLAYEQRAEKGQARVFRAG